MSTSTQKLNPFGKPPLPYISATKLEEGDIAFRLLQITSITKEIKKELKTVWQCDIVTTDGERKILSLGENPKRDELMVEAQALLQDGVELPTYKMVKIGNAFYFVTDDDILVEAAGV